MIKNNSSLFVNPSVLRDGKHFPHHHNCRCALIPDSVGDASKEQVSMIKNSLYYYEVSFYRLVDGDTLRLHIELGLDTVAKQLVRLKGLNAPEMKGDTYEAGVNAKSWLETKLASAKTVYCRTFKVKSGTKKDKYGRYLAILYEDDNPVSINDQMIAAGHATPYMD